MTETLRGTAVAIRGRGVLLRGPSGAGKSDLALRLVARGARLIGDDYVQAGPDGRLSPVPSIAGLVEVRGVGIRRLDAVADVPLALVVDLVPEGPVDRLPAPAMETVAGVAVPRVALRPFEASAAFKVELAMAAEPDAASASPGPGIRYKQALMDEAQDVAEPARPGCTGGCARVVLITGMSGAGRTTALKLLEDMGFEAVDNLPLSLLPRLVTAPDGDKRRPVAVGIDTRTRDFCAGTLIAETGRLIAEGGLECRVIFLDCDDDTLVRRFTETRRRHPLAIDRPVTDGVRLERELVAPLRERADLVIDTSILRPPELKRVLSDHLGLGGERRLSVFVTSFSFRNGLPRSADLVFDVRFLDNPHYDPALRELTGLDPKVAAYIAADSGLEPFLRSLTALLAPLLPRYDREGKSYLTLAIGCTGGRHRSVYVAERLGAWLRENGQAVTVAHRDIPPPPPAAPAEEQPTGRSGPAAS